MTHSIDPSTVATMQGRELDAAIAHWLFRRPSVYAWPNATFPFADIPYYSTDPAAFFAMVEAVRAKCAGVDMAWGPDGDWHIWLALDASASRAVTATADTLPLAFARAALLACLSDDANQKGG